VDNEIPLDVLDKLVEMLARVEHERWSHWQQYMHSKCDRKPDGSQVIPSELVEQWERQIATPYGELSDAEKESDRNQVRRYLPIIFETLGIVASSAVTKESLQE
jgi:hypothetical protein